MAGCFACSVGNKVFVLKFFNYSFVDIALYFNSKTILLQMLDSTNLQDKDRVLYCKHLNPITPHPLPPHHSPTNQSAKQYPN